MINRKLVLVLGAGASKPFGFPLGGELTDFLVGELSRNNPMWVTLVKMGVGERQILDFQEALSKCGRRSVDAFLEHRSHFMEIGKLAMACALLPKEHEPSLFARGESWYQYLFDRLNTRFEEFSQNTVSVLTFNYDRSLEHYLFTALKNSYGKTHRECAETLQAIPVLHLYGQLGALPYLTANQEEAISFGDNTELIKAARGIRIIHEELSADDPVFRKAHDLLREAERVCFLGFGYNSTNLERLMAYKPARDQLLMGCTTGFSHVEQTKLVGKFQALGFPVTIFHPNRDSLEFLHEHCPFDWD